MRALTAKELELVAGGLPTETVTVTASRIYGPDPGGGGNPFGGSGGYGGGSNTGCDPAPHPAGVALDHLDCKAYHMAQHIKEQGNYQDDEYASFLYIDPQGNLQSTGLIDMHTRNGGDIVIPAGTIPTGSTLVGYIHDHPASEGTDEAEPSSGGPHTDWSQVANLATTFANSGLTVDPNFETYILDDKTGNVYRYDIDHMNDSTTLGALVPPCTD